MGRGPGANQSAIDQERRRNILQFIPDFTEIHGYPPSFRQVGEGTGMRSTSTVQQHLNILRELGRVTWTDGVARTLKVIPI